MELKKNILLLSTTDVHGAYEAIYRIASFLKKADYEVAMVVKTKTQSDDFVIEAKRPQHKRPSLATRIMNRLGIGPKAKPVLKVEKSPKYLFLDEDERFSGYTADDLLSKVPFVPDLIISGINNGFLNTTVLADLHEKTSAKVVLITVDMYSMTGGCHYAWECTGYQKDCANCPGILNEEAKNWTLENLRIKQSNIKRGKIEIVAGSGWTLNQARLSTLFKNQSEILNTNSCIDTQLFNPDKRNIAKQVFDIPQNAKVIFTGSFGINDPRKGFSYFVEALKLLWQSLSPTMREEVHILVIGKDSQNDKVKEIPFKKISIDFIKDYRLLSLAYQAADIFVCASVEDSGPMMVSEALACGTPVVGFEMGITYNMVEAGYNGYKAVLKDSHDLAKGMKTILDLDRTQFEQYSANAVYQVKTYSAMERVLEVVGQLMKTSNKI